MSDESKYPYYRKQIEVCDRRDDIYDALAMVSHVINQEDLDDKTLTVTIQTTSFPKPVDENADDSDQPKVWTPFGPAVMMGADAFEAGYMVTVTGYTKHTEGVAPFIPTPGDTNE